MNEFIVNPKWLNENKNNSKLIILDASPKSNKSGLKTDFENIQIKNARYIDIKNDFSDKNSKYPNTLLKPKQFEIACRKLGINKSSKVVVYDNLGIYTSPRVWWMFKTMGHHKIAVLNGGLPNWIKKGYVTEPFKKNLEFKLGDFLVNFQEGKVKYTDFIKTNIKTQNHLLIDARSSDRFNDLVSDPRKKLRNGNIPESVNLPFQDVLENGVLKSKKELVKLFEKININDKPLIFTCGSGITACIILLASELVLDNEKSVYDGSWSEWSQVVQH